MAQILQFGNRTVTEAEVFRLLAEYQMLPQLCRSMIIDSAIASVTLTVEERKSAIEQFYQKNQITTPELLQSWLLTYGMTTEQLEALATKELRIEKFKMATWGAKIESIFLNNKSQLDKVVYSLIRTPSMEVAQELFFRILAGEQTFAECAKEYSQGAEAQTGGLLGPVPLSQPHPTIAKMLSTSQPGELLPPTKLGEWVVILRLEKFISAQLDDAMRAFLLNQMFETMLAEAIRNAQPTILNDTPTPVLLTR
ncbi:peptidylprolyl isomerase [Tolypothrix bouteillei VB521301_2]|uniref:peptidylprolyl isomerase n=1 Tax=Tolypothrix bouteillei VB521301 TaxID=1479485 RepID=A0A0C1RE52_9CYAN